MSTSLGQGELQVGKKILAFARSSGWGGGEGEGGKERGGRYRRGTGM